MQQRVSFAGESSLNGHYYLLSPFGYLPLPCCLRTLTPLFLVHLSRWVGSHRANDKDVNRRYEKNQFIENSDLIPCKVATRAKFPGPFPWVCGFPSHQPARGNAAEPARPHARVSLYVTTPSLALSPSIAHHTPLSRFHPTLSPRIPSPLFLPLHQSCRKTRRFLEPVGWLSRRAYDRANVFLILLSISLFYFLFVIRGPCLGRGS